uniref:Fatty acid desaturase domain-containing protein n=1 Tax=Tetradesmus obliquus TaxID=3088 RepID=A0A383W3P9_TETOB|eukprot:jgi/Sobl393_1/2998/SZX71840.1
MGTYAPLRRVQTRVAEVVLQEANPPSSDEEAPIPFSDLSYNKQYDELFKQQPLPLKQIVPKPNRSAQAQEPGSKKVLFSDVHAIPRKPLFTNREYNEKDKAYIGWMTFVHGLALLAPFTFSWSNLALFGFMYFITGCLGITLSFHRQLAHRSFQTPKWLEYALSYCGVLAVEGDPIEWVSAHRYHHLHCDTPLDPHSPYEGFWWSHMGWLLDNKTTKERVYDQSNAKEMEGQAWYRWIRETYPWHVVAQLVALYAFGGLGGLVWGGALRLVWVYHITWFVNSASHCWGSQSYNTGDLSRNNWWVGILAWGEGWHNNHHAFEFSARHGLEWWQVDMTWYIIRGLQAVGLAKNVKLPTEKQKARLAFPKTATA